MKTRIILITYFLLLSLCGTAYHSMAEKVKKVTYEQFSNGNLVENRNLTIKSVNGVVEILNTSKIEKSFLDYNEKLVLKDLDIDGKYYQQKIDFSKLPQASIKEEEEVILGYKCQKASFNVFSNKVDVWYTKEADLYGSPSMSIIIDDALILKYVVNGNRAVIAKSITTEKEEMSVPQKGAREISEARYRELIIESRYTRIPIFEKEQINFEGGLTNPENEILNHTYRFSKGTVIMKKVSLPKFKKGGYYFLKLTNWSNGDAYDRTGCVFTIADDNKKSILHALRNGIDELPVFQDKNGRQYQGVVSDDKYSVPIELMRFFTSFGVGHFNQKRPINNYNWQDSVVYKQEVSELIPSDKEEMWFGVFIGNYDKGGHQVSLDLNYYPPFEEPGSKKKLIQPLFYTLNIMEASGQNYGRMFKNDTLSVQFTLEEGVENPKLLYTTTGHGGWGNGDEFVPRLNQIFIDDKLVFSHVPWRSDCATYRMSNPASGNFGNGLSSSDLSRSNWCPACLTPPYYIPLEISPGKHRIKILIDQGDDEGSSFNHWSVSGIIVGDQ